MAQPSVSKSETNYALTYTDKQGHPQQRWPLRNPREIKAAAAALVQHRHMMDFSLRKTAAARILAESTKQATPVDEFEALSKIAGHGVCSRDQLTAAITLRKNQASVRFPQAVEKLSALAYSIATADTSICDNGVLVKIATVLDAVDREIDFTRQVVGYPEDMLFGITQHTVSEVKEAYVQLPHGSIYARADFEKFTPDKLADWFGDAFAKTASCAGVLPLSPEEFCEKLATLPNDTQAQFDEFADSIGVAPIKTAKQAPAELPLNKKKLVALATGS